MSQLTTWFVPLMFSLSLSVASSTVSASPCQDECEVKYAPVISETNTRLRELLNAIGEETDEVSRRSLREQHGSVTLQLDRVQAAKLHCVLACFQ